MGIRIIHTADVHLDASFSGQLGAEKGKLKREAIRGAFRRIVDDCLSWPADIFIIAGDLFEDDRVSADTIGFLKEQFRRLDGMPVVIAPGNHDPFSARGWYAVTDWGPNVSLFTRPAAATFRFPSLGLEVHGVAHDSRHMQGRLAQYAGPAGDGDLMKLLVAHASDETAIPEDMGDDVWLRFSREEVAALGYGYVALGHYHGAYAIEANGCPVAAYPGAPEGLRFSEKGARGYARVTLERGKCSVEMRSASQLDFCEFTVACDGFESREQFFSAVAALAGPDAGRLIARVRAGGRVAPGFDLCVDLPDDVRSKFFSVAVSDETLPAYDWGEIAGERSLRGEIVRRFTAEIDAADASRHALLERARLYAMDSLAGSVAVPAEARSAD